MSEKRVLLIDDSATIRRLVDTELSAAGFHVLLAATAEDGLEKAATEKPDLIILDHQLPGTTGYEVCCQLLEKPETACLPIVASSTLRKKAYSEYVDCDNVVDMLPKPYTPEVLVATVENAMDTAAMIVQSQSDGSAVPEVIDEQGDADLSGSFGCFGLREVIDLLNNGCKSGVLEVMTDEFRVYVFTDRGRIQAVTGSGIDTGEFAAKLPENMSELAPVAKSTVAGKKGSEMDGLVELLDNKVLDPRLLKKLLRLQAAILLRMCFNGNVKSFRFDKSQSPSKLFTKLPLDSSLVALMVEGAMNCSADELPKLDTEMSFVRRTLRGQSVDRAGLTTKQVQLMKELTDPATIEQLAERMDWTVDDTFRVLVGFQMVELVEQVEKESRQLVYSVSHDNEFKADLQKLVSKPNDEFQWKSVSDCLALNLLMRRQRPHVIVMDVSSKEAANKFRKVMSQDESKFSDIRLIAVKDEGMNLKDETLAKQGFDFAITKGKDFETLLSNVLQGDASLNVTATASSV